MKAHVGKILMRERFEDPLEAVSLNLFGGRTRMDCCTIRTECLGRPVRDRRSRYTRVPTLWMHRYLL